MRRISALFLICLVLALTTACGKAAESKPEQADTEEPIVIARPEPEPTDEPEPAPEPTPAWERGIAAGYGIGVLYARAERGTEVRIIGEDGAYYTISFDDRELFVEKRFIRDITGNGPGERTAYAGFGAEIYAGPYLTGEPLEKPAVNTALTVIDEFGGLMLVKTGSTEGYISSSLVSPVRLTWSAGNDSGDSGQGSTPGAFAGGTDGGDITLGKRTKGTAVAVELSARYEELPGGRIPEHGTILADGTEIYLGMVFPGDELMVLSAEGRTAEIYTSRGTGTLPRWVVLLGSEMPYDTWTGYASYGAKLFYDWHITGGYDDVWLNTVLTVILETDGGYFVQLSDGTYGYMDRTAVSRNMVVINKEDTAAPEAAAGEWTVPVL